MGNKIILKGPRRQKQTQEQNFKKTTGVGKLGWFMSKTKTATSPSREGEPTGTGQTKSVAGVDIKSYKV